jgi:hypothetical protein
LLGLAREWKLSRVHQAPTPLDWTNFESEGCKIE